MCYIQEFSAVISAVQVISCESDIKHQWSSNSLANIVIVFTQGIKISIGDANFLFVSAFAQLQWEEFVWNVDFPL